MDPNDPDGDTLWVGTGEANACGSGCEAGVGLYKSNDGGDTWSGPMGQSVFNERAIGSIVVKPGDPEHDLCGDDAGSSRPVVGLLQRHYRFDSGSAEVGSV